MRGLAQAAMVLCGVGILAAAPFAPLAIAPDARTILPFILVAAALALFTGVRKRHSTPPAGPPDSGTKKRPWVGRIWLGAGFMGLFIAFVVLVSSWQTQSEYLTTQAHQAYDRGEFETCSELYTEAARIAPGHYIADLLYQAARCSARAHHTDDTLALLDRVLDHGFDDAEQIAADWDLRLLRRDPRWPALLERARAIQRVEARARSLRRRARKAYQRGDFARCASLYVAAAEKSEDDDAGENWYNAACCSARTGQIDRAFEQLDRALDWGFDDFEHIFEDPDLVPLRNQERWKTLLSQLPGQEP